MRATQIQSGGLSILTDHLIVFIAFANPICSNYSFLQLGSSPPNACAICLQGLTLNMSENQCVIFQKPFYLAK